MADEIVEVGLKLTGYADFKGDLNAASKQLDDFADKINKLGGMSLGGLTKDLANFKLPTLNLPPINVPSLNVPSDFGKEFKTAGGHVAELAGKLGDLGGKIAKGAIDGVEGVGKAALSAGEKLAGFALDIGKVAARAGGDFIKDSINAYNDFEAKIQEVKGVSDNVTEAQVDSLKKLAIQMGKDLPISAGDAASSFVELAKAGFTVDEITNKFGNSLAYLSTAGGLSMGRSTEILSAALRSYEIDATGAAHATDVLAKTANVSAVDISDIGETLKYVGPVAHAAGTSLEETSAAIAVLGNVGIKGSMAGTTLRSVLGRLVAPPKQAAEALMALGFEMEKSDGTVKTLDEALRELRPKFAKLTVAQQEMFAAQIAGKPAMAGFLQLLKTGQGDYDAITASIKNADGAAKQMSDTMMDSGKGSFEQLGGSVETLRIAFVDKFAKVMQNEVLGNITKLVNAAIPAAEFFGEKFAKAIGVAGQALGAFASAFDTQKPVDTSKFNPLQNFFYSIGNLVNTVAIPAIKGFVDFLGSTVLPAVGKLAEFIGTQMLGALSKLGSDMQSTIQPAFTQISQIIQTTVMPGVLKLAGLFTDTVLPAASSFAQFIVTQLLPPLLRIGSAIINDILPPVIQFATSLLQTLTPVFKSIADTVANVVMPAIVSFTQNTLPKILDVIKPIAAFIADPLVPVLGKIASVILNDVAPIVVNLADIFVKNLMPVITDVVKFVGDSLIPKVQEFAGYVKTDVVPTVQDFAEKIGPVLGGAFNFLKPIIEFFFNFTQNELKAAFGIFKTGFEIITGGVDVAGKALGGFGDFIGGVWKGISDTVGNAWRWIQQNVFVPIQYAVTDAQRFFTNLAINIGNAFNNVRNTIMNIANGIKGAFQNALNWVIDRINDVIGFANSAIRVVRNFPGLGWMGEIGTIPHVQFAKGGLVTGPTRALIGEAGPEAVLPLDRLIPAISQGVQSGLTAMTASAQQIYNTQMMSSSSSYNYNDTKQYQLTMNTMQSTGSVIRDFGMMEALS